MNTEETVLEDLYQELDKIKTKAKQEYKDVNIKINLAELEKRIAQSQHLIDLKNLKIDNKWLERLFKNYLLILEKYKKENGEIAKKLDQGFKQQILDLETLAKKVFHFDSVYLETLAKKMNLKIEDLAFLGLQLINPVFELYAEKLIGKIETDKWSRGYCPVCGSPPVMAYLRKDDGKRILWCQFCGTKWSFLRLKCPFCSNEDQKTLKYFFTEENNSYRVYLCEKCKKYIKTIDQRKMKKGEKLDLGWKNIETLALDFLAQKEGYSSQKIVFSV